MSLGYWCLFTPYSAIIAVIGRHVHDSLPDYLKHFVVERIKQCKEYNDVPKKKCLQCNGNNTVMTSDELNCFSKYLHSSLHSLKILYTEIYF